LALAIATMRVAAWLERLRKPLDLLPKLEGHPAQSEHSYGSICRCRPPKGSSFQRYSGKIKEQKEFTFLLGISHRRGIVAGSISYYMAKRSRIFFLFFLLI
jgi:hypothetical protein